MNFNINRQLKNPPDSFLRGESLPLLLILPWTISRNHQGIPIRWETPCGVGYHWLQKDPGIPQWRSPLPLWGHWCLDPPLSRGCHWPHMSIVHWLHTLLRAGGPGLLELFGELAERGAWFLPSSFSRFTCHEWRNEIHLGLKMQF